MIIKKILILLVFLLACFSMAAATPTTTPTVTPTLTTTITQTHTVSPTISPTWTITQTHTNTPTPQATVYSYPNPAAYRDDMGIAYPITAGKSAAQVIINIHALNGDHVAMIARDNPNGYTMIDISGFARGIYFYTLKVKYQDGTEDSHYYRKFAIIK